MKDADSKNKSSGTLNKETLDLRWISVWAFEIDLVLRKVIEPFSINI